MAVGTKQVQIFWSVVLAITIFVVELDRYFLPKPLRILALVALVAEDVNHQRLYCWVALRFPRILAFHPVLITINETVCVEAFQRAIIFLLAV